MTFWNGVSDPELYFFYETCDITDYIHVEGVVDPLLFPLDIFKFFSSY